MAFLKLQPLETHYAISDNFTTIEQFNTFKESLESDKNTFTKNFEEHINEYKEYKERTDKNLSILQKNSALTLENTKALNLSVQRTEATMKAREIFVEDFVKQVNSNVKIMQAYVERQLLDARIEQEITQRQLHSLLTLPWYKRFTKKQRARILERVRNEVIEEYKELKEAAEKKINESLIQGNITIKTPTLNEEDINE
ncbi:MAG: hypothetical protein IJI22_06295 [Bacilli bacterium]|nr:hypothetical protein [Bacilli bacterium]MBQ7277458.1 hypothetical protein [Bacilli bacterium]